MLSEMSARGYQKLVIEVELQNKHIECKKTKKELRSISVKLRTTLGFILFNAILKKTNIAMKSRIKAITYPHEKKLKNLRKLQQNYVNTKTKQHPIKQIIHNFSLYVLSRDEKIALSYRLDQHVPSNLNKTDIEPEFEQFYHGLLKDISNIPEENLSTLKTKLRSTCEKYTRIKVPYKYQQTVKKLSKNQSIVIMKQEKDRGVVIMYKSKMILGNDNFKTLDCDPTKKPEEKIQRILRKM